MREKLIYIYVLLTIIFSGCERVEEPDEFDARQIKLFARIDASLEVEETKGTSTDEAMGIGIVRIDQGSDPSYPYFRNCSLLTANLGGKSEENLRLVSGFKTDSGADAPQFFRNNSSEVRYTAWYPWPKTTTAGYDFSQAEDGTTTVTFPIPATGDSDILYSNSVKGTMTTGFDVMTFNHALSLFNIYVYKGADNDVWGDLTSVSIDGLPDICKLTLPSFQDKNTYVLEYAKSNDTGLTLNYELPEEIQDIPFGFENRQFIKEWIAAPAVLGETKGLNIDVTTEGNGHKNVLVAGNFMAGHAYDIILRFSDDGVVNASVEVSDWQNSDERIDAGINAVNVFYDLSQNETANCYIVSSANFGYCFDATVKGNGSVAAFPGGRIDPNISPKSVKVVWCDNAVKEYFHLETEKIVEGKVLFKVKGNPDNNDDKTLRGEGNVLLGVCDDSGNYLWTWHIWITDRPQKQNYTKGYIVLDRNLGATAPTPEGDGNIQEKTRGMKGLFYQWGRPTPFRVIPDEKNVGSKKIDGDKSWTRVTPDEAVANPKVFYGRFENESSDPSATNFHDWVDRGRFSTHINHLWGYREEEHMQPIKTIYDPCPPGYHVPYSRNWGNMQNYWAEKNSVVTWETLSGIQFTIEGNDQIWYPFQGYIDKDGVYKVGHMHMHDGTATHEDTPIVEVWSSLINRHEIGDTDDDEPYRFLFTIDYGSMLSDSHSNRSRGLAVRCVSNNTTSVVKNLSASQTANCYMVHEDGYYKFNATVRGNGVGSLLPLGGTTTAEINGGLSTKISPYVVDVLWWQGDFTKSEDQTSTDNMCLTLLDNGIVGQDGYVAFQITNFSKGNVILAAYDDEDRTTILWTWHIWLTDKPKDKLSGNYTKMDRFLGATFAPEIGNSLPLGGPAYTESPQQSDQVYITYNQLQATFGFYYQWGRKDPIIGPPSYNIEDDPTEGASDSVPSAVWWEKNSEGTWTEKNEIRVKEAALIPEVVKDPTAFYRSTTEKSQPTSQWFPASFADGYTNVALWGYAVKNYGIAGQTFSKTMHDPCPPGYRTPFHFSWRYDSEYKYAEGDDGEAPTWFGAEAWFVLFADGVPHGIATNKPHFERMWYPFAGYRSPLTGRYKDVGVAGYMYTGMPMGQYNTRSFWYTQGQSGQYCDPNGHGSAYGKMIRCMKE